jgi:L-ascorbate metabolism protein UlaG (beta-lactamase superfamily)
MQPQQLQRLGTVTIFLVLLVPFGAFLVYLNWHPGIEPERHDWIPRSTEPAPEGLTLMWLGAAGVYVSDGDTALLIDGFFTRPRLTRIVFGELEPDPERIRAALEKAGIKELDAVIATHAHFDHALDAPWIAEHFNALLLGSSSVANLARGQGLAEALIREVDDGASFRMGEFRLRFPRSKHVPLPPLFARLAGADRSIERPLVLPAPARDFHGGPHRAVHLAHPRGKVLIQASAGHEPGALTGLDTDVILTSVAGLEKQSQTYQSEFVQHGLQASQPEWVLPMDWDHLARPVSGDAPPQPLLLGNVRGSLRVLEQALEDAAARVRLTRPLWRLRLVGSGQDMELLHDPSS